MTRPFAPYLFFFMYILLLLVSVLITTATALVVNNKTVVCYGGPGTLPTTDLYNQDGDWNRTYYPAEPQQIHTSWVSNGKALRVQFSTMASIESSRLHYWYDADEDNTVHDSLDWVFVDGGIEKKSQFMHTFISKQLEPSTIYKYKIETMDKDQIFVSNTYEFHTPQEDTPSFKFLATGDLVGWVTVVVVICPLMMLLIRVSPMLCPCQCLKSWPTTTTMILWPSWEIRVII